MQTAKFTQLRWTIVTTGVAVAALMTVFFVFDRLRQRDQILESAIHDTTTSAMALAEHTEQVFTSVELLMQHIAGEVNGRVSFDGIDRSALHQELKSINDGAAFIDSISIQDAGGYVFVSSDYVDPPHVSYAFREHFKVQRDDPWRGFYIGQPIKFQTNGSIGIPLSLRLNDSTASGKFAGIVYAAMPVDYFKNFYHSLNMGFDSRVRLLRQDGHPLIEEPAGQNVRGGTYASFPWFADAVKHGFNGIHQGDGSVSGDPRIIGYRKIANYPLMVTVSFSRTAVLEPWRKENWHFGGVLVMLLTIVTGVCVWMLRLVSERERWVVAIRDAQLAAEQANRAKSDFLASMSHEIRTPMNGILGFAQLLRDGTLTDVQRRYVTYLMEAGTSLLAIINDILDLSKIEAGKLELESIPFSPSAVVQSAISTVRPQVAEKKLDIDANVDAVVPECLLGDSTRLRQILLNLLTNAVKFTEKGRIGVVVTRQGDSARGVKLRFEVSDTGIGIPQENQKNLFQNFTQVDNSIARRFGGTGLGLAISKRLAEAMGGDIGLTSSEGQGSTFWFTIDLPQGEARKRVSRTNTPMSQSPKARILVAEDVPMNRTIIEAMLRGGGHQVTFADNGRLAVEALRTGDYDLVLMDVSMPEMDGLAATRAIRALGNRGRAIPIIALTASAMTDEIASCKAAGMDDYIGKPVDRDALLMMVDTWTRQERLQAAGVSPL